MSLRPVEHIFGARTSVEAAWEDAPPQEGGAMAEVGGAPCTCLLSWWPVSCRGRAHWRRDAAHGREMALKWPRRACLLSANRGPWKQRVPPTR